MAIRILSSESISGNITIHSPSNAPYIDFVENADTGDSKARITMDQIDTNNGTLLFATEGGGTLTERMRIDSSGNSTFTGNIILGDGTVRSIIGATNQSLIINAKPNSSAEGLLFQINGTDKLSILQDGNATFAGNVDINGGEVKISGNYAKLFFEDTGGTIDAYIVNNADGLFFGKTNSPTPANDILSLDLSTKYVGIGTTSPSTILDVSSGASASQTAQINLNGANGAATELVMRAGGDDGGTIYNRRASIRYYSNQISTTTAQWVNGASMSQTTGDDKFYFNNSSNSTVLCLQQNGNVGIGTVSPNVLLQLRSNINTIPANTDFAMRSGKSFRFLGDGDGNADYGSYIEAPTKGIITIGTRWVGADEGGLTVNRANVGIGTTSPERKLHVFKGESGGATSNSDSSLVLENSSNTYLQFLTPTTVESGILFGDTDNDVGAFTYSHSTNSFNFRTAGVSNRMVIDSSGNVGIGGSPSVSFEIAKAGARIKMIDGTNQLNMGLWDGANYRFEGDANRPMFFTSYQGNINFGISGGTTMTIQSSNVGIGVTSPASRFEVYGGSSGVNDVDRYVRFKASNGEKRFDFHIGGTGNASRLDMYQADGATYGARISSSGDSYVLNNFGIGTSTPQTKLDVRGNIIAGDSTTNNTMRRKYQNFSTTKPGPSSGGSIDIMFVDHTHALDITVMAYISTASVATGRGYSLLAYGGGTGAGLTQTSFAGAISALSISYINSGGSENYILRVNVTYSGSTAPTITMTANGASTSKLRAAV